MNKQKIIVSTLALAMGAALAGSVSGTVAWFQYSTRAQAAYIGTTAHCSEALEIQAVKVGGTAVEANWKTELKATDVASALTIDDNSAYATNLTPITSGSMDANDALPTDFYSNPIYQHFALSEWEKATVANYARFELHFRVKDVNGASATSYLAKNVYLTDLSIVSLGTAGTSDVNADTDNNNDNDLYKAVRVHISCGSTNLLFANDGTSGTTVETVTSSTLDLNNDGQLDKEAAYDWETAGSAVAYGTTSSAPTGGYKQVANNIGGFDFTDDDNPTIPDTAVGDGLLGATTDSAVLKATVTIWFEGWQGLSDEADLPSNVANSANDAQVWEPSTYIGQKFGVGFRFAVPAHIAH